MSKFSGKKKNEYSIYSNNNTLGKDKKYSHKEEIEQNENNQKCPGYYNLIQIEASNEINNEPPESLYILDNYDFEGAIKYDKRSFWRIYYIFLLSTENILNTFFFKTPLEIQPLRLSLFVFNYACDFALNALFFLNQNISDKYHYSGDNLFLFTLANNFTISLVSTTFSYILIKFLNFFIDSKESIEDLFRKQEKIMRNNKNYKVKNEEKMRIHEKLLKIYKILKVKIIIYIIMNCLFLIFFLYYVTAFCEVYKNTQKSWLTDCLLSFLLSIPVELLVSFNYSVLYYVAIKYRFKILYRITIFFYGLG